MWEFECYTFTPYSVPYLPPGFVVLLFMFSMRCEARGLPFAALLCLN